VGFFEASGGVTDLFVKPSCFRACVEQGCSTKFATDFKKNRRRICRQWNLWERLGTWIKGAAGIAKMALLVLRKIFICLTRSLET